MDIDKSKIKVGDEVYYAPTWTRNDRLVKKTIAKIGRKYITLDDGSRFEIETMREKTDYGASSILHLSEKDYYDKIKATENVREIRILNDSYGYKLTLDQTLRIIDIFHESENRDDKKVDKSKIVDQITSWSKKGILIEYIIIDQIDNGYQKAVKDGDMPRYTYTVSVFKDHQDLYQESFDDLMEALQSGLKFVENKFGRVD